MITLDRRELIEAYIEELMFNADQEDRVRRIKAALEKDASAKPNEAAPKQANPGEAIQTENQAEDRD